MARKIKVTNKANKRFEEILIYLNENFGKASSEKFIKRTYSFFDIIVEYPNIGRIEDVKKGIHGFVLEKSVTVFYRFSKNNVIILNFFDNRMNPNKK